MVVGEIFGIREGGGEKALRLLSDDFFLTPLVRLRLMTEELGDRATGFSSVSSKPRFDLRGASVSLLLRVVDLREVGAKVLEGSFFSILEARPISVSG